MEFAASFGRALLFGIFSTAWICIVFWGVARLWPRGERPSRQEARKAASFWAVFIVAGAIIFTLNRYYGPRIEPLFDLRGTIRGLPTWLYFTFGAFLFLCLYDFFNYWMHRAQHKWFWRQHRIHHSVRNLSALNSYFHPTEHLFRLLLIYYPLALFFGGGAGGFGVAVAMLNTAQGYFVHVPTRFNYGPLRCLMVDNVFHRIHHSVEPEHFEKNFGAFTTLWDRLFGTAYWPANGEWPETGVWDFEEVETVGDYIRMGRPQPAPARISI